MYIPKHFAITDRDEIFKFIESNAFGQLVSSVAGKPFATHMPFLVDADRGKLIGHIARQNPQHLDIEGQQVLITLQGPHAYISPSWYVSAGVPTWNYQAVHVYGTCEVFSDLGRIKQVIDALTQKYESVFPEPWQPEYHASLLGAIVGLEITITEIQCKFKLGQNRSLEDRQQVAVHLEKRGALDMVAAMQIEK